MDLCYGPYFLLVVSSHISCCLQMEQMEGRWLQLNFTATSLTEIFRAGLKRVSKLALFHPSWESGLTYKQEKKKISAAISKSILSCPLKLPAAEEIYASFNNGFKKFFDEKLSLGLPLLSMLHPQYMSYWCQVPSYHRCPFSERGVFMAGRKKKRGLANSSSHGTFFLAGSIGQPIKKENISVFFCRVIRF